MQTVLCLFPWVIRVRMLRSVFGFQIDESCRIGFSIVMSRRVVMLAGSRIGHFNVVKGLDLLHLGTRSSIGRLNWISGFPTGGTSSHFREETDRAPELFIGEHAAITNRHLIDCTNRVTIGKYATLAGFRSQILTHSIDIFVSRQRSKPVSVGDFCFVGTGCVLLPGAGLPSYSVLGALSLLNKAYDKQYALYGGNPAREIKSLPQDSAYFRRAVGFVH